MNPIDRNPLNIEDPAIRRLSEFLFANYHTNPGSKSHSHVSDRLAVNLAGNPETVMELAGLIARTIDPNFEGTVIGFFVQRETKSLIEQLFPQLFDTKDEGLDTKDEGLDPMADVPLVGMMGIEPMALWHRAHLWLKDQGYYDVSFDHSYHHASNGSKRPAIHGAGLGIAEINNAMVHVLVDQAPQYLSNIGEWLATTHDDDGWVFCETMSAFDA